MQLRNTLPFYHFITVARFRDMHTKPFFKNKAFLLLLVGLAVWIYFLGRGSDRNSIGVVAKAYNSIEVVATAYNSIAKQTNKNPTVTAWGDILKPGMKSIAVSRDLIDLGLVHKTEVTIEGLQGKYKVLDKMNKRWKKRIDIYMGNDVKSAKKWGKKRVKISWKRNKNQRHPL